MPDNKTSNFVPQTFDPSKVLTASQELKQRIEAEPAPLSWLPPGAAPQVQTPSTPKNETIYQTSLQNFKNRSELGLTTGSVAAPFENLHDWVDNKFFDSPILDTNQKEELQKDRPGFKLPKTVTKLVADNMQSRFDRTQRLNFLIQHTRTSTLGKVAGWAGSLIGSIPDMAIAGVQAFAATSETDNPYMIPEIFGEDAPWLRTLFNETAEGKVSRLVSGIQAGSQRITKGAYEGAKAGAFFGETRAVGVRATDAASGQSYNNLMALDSVRQNMIQWSEIGAAGGLISPLFKPIKSLIKGPVARILKRNLPFSREGAKDSAHTSMVMAAAGKDPDYQLATRNAFNQASQLFKKKISDAGIKESTVRDQLNDEQDQLNSEITDNSGTIDNYHKAFKKIKLNEVDLFQMAQLHGYLKSRYEPNLEIGNLEQVNDLQTNLNAELKSLKKEDPENYRATVLSDDMPFVKKLAKRYKKLNDGVRNNPTFFDQLSDTLKSKSLKDITDDYSNYLQRESNLDFAKNSIELHKRLLDNEEKEIPQEILDHFAEENKTSKNDFKMSGGDPKLDAVGPEFKDIQNVLDDKFDPEHQKFLENDSMLSDEDKETFKKLSESKQDINKVKTLYDNFIKCERGLIP